MYLFKKNDLKKLLEITDEYCVSLYLPTHKTGREQQQDPEPPVIRKHLKPP